MQRNRNHLTHGASGVAAACAAVVRMSKRAGGGLAPAPI